jgi:uracil-DNA glycosylase
VLLLNTALTVRPGQAGSHATLGWDTLTDAILALLSSTRPNLVFLLWGAHAQKKAPLIDVRLDTTAGPVPSTSRPSVPSLLLS